MMMYFLIISCVDLYKMILKFSELADHDSKISNNLYHKCSPSQLAQLVASRSEKARRILDDNKDLDDAIKTKLESIEELLDETEKIKKEIEIHRKIENIHRDMEIE